ncbi:recombinase family protein [Yinghuangia sp. ASG 101]|uniref:recombinase family protein n=1 Tax=Yinghuangia sp. ASG 101 TaxID=2896848 RepID=UPI001E46A5AF|nr:recombinase family protein [Yinghuangia sp. ASG 101]UGQ14289.1 recombinase family protein [Yinghuangia sp. ASG 101]
MNVPKRYASTTPNPPLPGQTGLSDLAVSPFAIPGALLRGEVRAAWVGRCSTEEQQDPRQSLIRQLERSKSALPEAWAIVCHFYDVESGRLGLDARGHGTTYERFGVPIARDGGIADLLSEATHPNRRFDVVICESTSRVARRMFENLSVERELENSGIPLFAWNEPIKLDGGRAQQILQRRINQSVAEYEVYNALETSWGGLCTHVREGWNIGKPPYGYRAKRYRHPNPTKADRGATKNRLEPDGAKGETVTQIALWRHHEGIGYSTIVDRLNADPERYPPPEPPGGKARARGAWSKSTVCDLLRNPKYTGYQVFNRRATRSRRGAHNDPALWVWSPEPVHEPLIPRWMFEAINATSTARQGSRDANTPNTHPQTRHTYVLRGMVLCHCGRRMFGNHRPRSTYYACWPRANNRGRPDRHHGHPKSVYIREDVLLEAIAAFYSDRVFGPDRRALLTAELATLDDRAARERAQRRDRLQSTLRDLERRQRNVLNQAQDCEPGDPFATGLRQTYNELETEKHQTETELAALANADKSDPAAFNCGTAALLDALPHLAINLTRAPERLQRQLFEITKLNLRLAEEADAVTITMTLPADYIPALAELGERMTPCAGNTEEPATKNVTGSHADAVRAPGRIRTCAHGSGADRLTGWSGASDLGKCDARERESARSLHECCTTNRMGLGTRTERPRRTCDRRWRRC